MNAQKEINKSAYWQVNKHLAATISYDAAVLYQVIVEKYEYFLYGGGNGVFRNINGVLCAWLNSESLREWTFLTKHRFETALKGLVKHGYILKYRKTKQSKLFYAVTDKLKNEQLEQKQRFEAAMLAQHDQEAGEQVGAAGDQVKIELPELLEGELTAEQILNSLGSSAPIKENTQQNEVPTIENMPTIENEKTAETQPKGNKNSLQVSIISKNGNSDNVKKDAQTLDTPSLSEIPISQKRKFRFSIKNLIFINKKRNDDDEKNNKSAGATLHINNLNIKELKKAVHLQQQYAASQQQETQQLLKTHRIVSTSVLNKGTYKTTEQTQKTHTEDARHEKQQKQMDFTTAYLWLDKVLEQRNDLQQLYAFLLNHYTNDLLEVARVLRFIVERTQWQGFDELDAITALHQLARTPDVADASHFLGRAIERSQLANASKKAIKTNKQLYSRANDLRFDAAAGTNFADQPKSTEPAPEPFEWWKS